MSIESSSNNIYIFLILLKMCEDFGTSYIESSILRIFQICRRIFSNVHFDIFKFQPVEKYIRLPIYSIRIIYSVSLEAWRRTMRVAEISMRKNL